MLTFHVSRFTEVYDKIGNFKRGKMRSTEVKDKFLKCLYPQVNGPIARHKIAQPWGCGVDGAVGKSDSDFDS